MTASINLSQLDPRTLARIVGGALLATILVGMATALTVADGIDINLSADVAATAQNMLQAETQLRAKSYIALLMFGLEAAIGVGLFLLLRPTSQLIAGWSLVVSIAAAILTLSGAVFNMNAAELASDMAYAEMASESQRFLLTGLQATSDYTSFHLALILSSVSKAGFFFLFLKSGLMPRLISGWGLFASLFVSTAIILRDFIPIVGHGSVTASFMVSNLIALVATALYLTIKGIRAT